MITILFASKILLLSTFLFGLCLADDTYGPWIVHFDKVIENSIFEQTVRAVYNAQLLKPASFHIKYSFKLALHALALSGLTREQLEAIPGVEFVDFDANCTKTQINSFGLDRINQASLPLDGDLSTDFDGAGVDIYVLDTGVDFTHEVWDNIGKDRTTENIFNAFGNVTSNTDGDDHGSHVAGIAGGNGIGPSNGANVYGVKVLDDNGSGSTSNVIAGIEEVISRHQSTSGARSVINMSLGSTCSNQYCAFESKITSIQSAHDAGIVVVVAAGNGACNSCTRSPASSVVAITVAASDFTDVPPDFSNYGQCVNMWAPGVAIFSACTQLRSECSGSNNLYLTKSGTSQASPYVAGVAAQLLQKNPTATPSEVLKAMQCDAVQNTIESHLYDTLTPNLLVQVPKNDGSFGECSLVDGCRDSCSNAGLCLQGHRTWANGDARKICHCDKDRYGDTCALTDGRSYPSYTCSNNNAMSVSFEMTDSDSDDGWNKARMAISNVRGDNIVQGVAQDSFCTTFHQASLTKTFCLQEGFYKLRVDSSDTEANTATVGWSMCGTSGGANYEGFFEVYQLNSGTFKCRSVGLVLPLLLE
jgi:hypothetical protein